jgi:hypothetical protein
VPTKIAPNQQTGELYRLALPLRKLNTSKAKIKLQTETVNTRKPANAKLWGGWSAA